MKLTAKSIYKTFGVTKAVDDVSIEFNEGEIHAVIGENGAGKSTLLKVISAVYPMDAGEVFLEGKPFKPSNHIESAKQGVGYVFQESTVNPHITVAENIFVDRLREFTNKLGLVSKQKLEQKAQEIIDYMGVEIDVKTSLWDLDLGKWKLIEIARALTFNPKVIFFDESTAYLNNQEVEFFLEVIRNLKKKGLAIGYVSHHMSEIFNIADVATIMKDGKWVAKKTISETTIEEVQRLMVGRELGNIYPKKKAEKSEEPIIEFRDVSCAKKLKGVSFTLYKGEILGVGGIKDSGGEEILAILNGDKSLKSGKVELYGKPYQPKAPYEALEKKITTLPGQRTLEGIIVDFSIKTNVNMGNIPRKAKGMFVDEKKETEVANDMIERVLIKADSAETLCSSLSGGNMQKVVLGKCLATNPNVVLLNNPTRGIDMGARLEIYKLIHSLSMQGITFLMLSEDLNELIGLSDRAIIMRRGEVSKEYDFNSTMREEDIITYML